MTFIVDDTSGATFPDSSTQAKAGLVAGGTIATGTVTTLTAPTSTITTLNAPSGVLATQNGMTGIAKAWVNFNGSTGAIRNSFNVSSITVNSTGNYTVNMTTAMPNANYAVALSTPSYSTSNGTVYPFLTYSGTGEGNTTLSTTQFNICWMTGGGTYLNPLYYFATVFSS